MPPSKHQQEPVRRSFTQEPGSESPGTFSEGHRVTTPSGAFVPDKRPSSQLMSRVRGVSPCPLEDLRIEFAPKVVSCGSPKKYRASSVGVGTRVIRTSESRTRPAASQSRPGVTAPEPGKIDHWLHSAKGLLKCGGSGSLHLDSQNVKVLADPNPLEGVFVESSHRLLRSWQAILLSRKESLVYSPAAYVAIDNITEQDQLSRTATLCRALLEYKDSIDAGEPFPVLDGKTVCPMEPMKSIFCFSQETDAEGNEKICFHEGARHVIVCHRDLLFEMEVVEPGGRQLYALELHARLREIVSLNAKPLCTIPFSKLSAMSRKQFAEACDHIAGHCTSNKTCLQRLNSAIFTICVSVDVEEGGYDPFILENSNDVDGFWLNKCLSLTVLPNGVAVLRGCALVVDSTVLEACAAWVANAANCDPMLAPPVQAPRQVTAMQRVIRTPTPTLGKKPPKPTKGQQAAAAAEESKTMLAPVTIMLPRPEEAAPPRSLPLWMPITFCRDFNEKQQHQQQQQHQQHSMTISSSPSAMLSLPRPYRITNFDVEVRDEVVLYLASVLALGHINPHRFPMVHAESYAAVRDPQAHLCLCDEVEVAVRHVREYTKFGPLRSEVEASIAAAVNALRKALAGPAFISDVRNMWSFGVLDRDRHKRDFLKGNVSGPPDLSVVKQGVQAHNPNLLWTLGTVRFHEDTPLLSFCHDPSSSAISGGGVASTTTVGSSSMGTMSGNTNATSTSVDTTTADSATSSIQRRARCGSTGLARCYRCTIIGSSASNNSSTELSPDHHSSGSNSSSSIERLAATISTFVTFINSCLDHVAAKQRPVAAASAGLLHKRTRKLQKVVM